MPKANNQSTSTATKPQDFQIPQDNNQAVDQNMSNADLSLNQIANQGVPAKESGANANIMKKEVKQNNQASVFGKSELLDANQILGEMLNIKIGHRVADLGAGGGMFSLQAARLVGDQGEVYAVDIMKNTLSDIESKARMANLYNVKAVWSNIEILGATKIPEASLDFVLLVNVLFQSKATDKMIAEGARLLKSGGKMLVVDWSNTKAGMGPHSDRQIDPNKIKAEAQAANLNLEQQFIAGQYHFGLIFIKP